MTKTQAQRFLVSYQHLFPPRAIRTREAIAAFIKKVGCIQYDPLNRVGRNADLFGFEYKWEVYTPKAKRKYGYYVLPVLFGESFVARFEPVVDREKNTLTILNWWWEDKVPFGDEMFEALMRCFAEFKTYCGVAKIAYRPTHHAEKMTWLGAIPCPTHEIATRSTERPSS